MDSLSTRAHGALRKSMLLLALGCAAFTVQALTGVGGADTDAFVSSWVYNGLLLGSALVCLARGVMVASQRWVWLTMGAGLLAWTAGEIYYWLAAPADGEVPVPSPADVGYLALYPAAALAIVLLLRSQVKKARLSLLLDGVTAALAVAAVAAALVAAPIIDAATTGDSMAVITNLSYPVGDLLLLAIVVAAFGLMGWRPGHTWILLGAGLAAMAVSDAAYLYQAAQETYVEHGVVDVGWVLAGLLVAWAAVAPSVPPGAPRLTGLRTGVVPLLAAVLAIAIETYDHFTSTSTVAVLLASATLVAVAARMALALRENHLMLEGSRRDATHDALTTLGNRRALNTALVSATAVPPRPGMVRLLIMLDLDGFKAYNDSFGHPAGDSLLARLGARLGTVSAPSGKAYRLGGDEFCVLGEVEAGMADVLVASATEALSEQGDGFTIQPSLGVVQIPREAATPSTALHLADRRMYAHKSSGRASAGRQTRDVLISTLRERQPELHEHVTDVAEMSILVADELGVPAEERDLVARAAELHDIGKVAIPDAILDKPGPLDDEEWQFMRRHTLIGERILMAAPALRPVAQLVRSSHERWDGAGYPDGIGGERVPLGARIVAVCDSYQAMVSDRPYRAAKRHEEAMAELARCAGTQFDPRVVAAFTVAVGRRRAEPRPV